MVHEIEWSMKTLVRYLFVAFILVGFMGGCSEDENSQPPFRLENTVWIYKSLPPHYEHYEDNPSGIYALCFLEHELHGKLVMLYELDENLKKKNIGLGYGYEYYGNKIIIGKNVCEVSDYWLKYKNMTFFKSRKTEAELLSK